MDQKCWDQRFFFLSLSLSLFVKRFFVVAASSSPAKTNCSRMRDAWKKEKRTAAKRRERSIIFAQKSVMEKESDSSFVIIIVKLTKFTFCDREEAKRRRETMKHSRCNTEKQQTDRQIENRTTRATQQLILFFFSSYYFFFFLHRQHAFITWDSQIKLHCMILLWNNITNAHICY